MGVAPDGCKPVAKLRFPNGYVANNTWVSGPFAPEEGIVEPSKSSLILGGIKLDADLQAVLVSFQFTSEKHEKVLKGTYGAVLSAKSLKGALPEFLGKFCIPTNFLGTDLVQLISSTTDIMSTPPFSADSNVDCDALTIGMGFTVLPSRIDGNKLPNGEFKPYIGNSLPINPCGGGAGGASGASGASGAAGQANGGSAGGGGASSGNGGFGG